MKRQLAILGSTGSIGTQALEVVAEHSDLFEVYALTANNQVDLLINQARRFMPEVVVIANEPDRFDHTLAPHHHMICIRCGQVTDIASGDMRAYIEKLAGVEIESYDLSIRYICPACREKYSPHA